MNKHMESDINFLKDVSKRVLSTKTFDSSLVAQLSSATESLFKHEMGERHVSLLHVISQNVCRLLHLAKSQRVAGQTAPLVDIVKKILDQRLKFTSSDVSIFSTILECCDQELNARNCLLKETIKLFLKFASKKHHHSSTEQAITTLNQMLTGTSRNLRHDLLRTAQTELLELVQYLLHCGDYYLQEIVLETFTRLAPSDNRKFCCWEWFADFPSEAKEAFMNFGNVIFQVEARIFLNALNAERDTGVHTVVCLAAQVDEYEFCNPTTEHQKDWYVDICSSTKAITFYAVRKEVEIGDDNPLLLLKITNGNVKSCSLLDTSKPGHYQFSAILHEPLEGLEKSAGGQDMIVSLILKLVNKHSLKSIMGDKFEQIKFKFQSVLFESNQASSPGPMPKTCIRSPEDPSFYMFKYPDDGEAVDWGAETSPEPSKARSKRPPTPAMGNAPHSPGMSTFADYMTVVDPNEDLEDEEVPEGPVKGRRATPGMQKGILKGSPGPKEAAAKRKGTPAQQPKKELKLRKSTPAVVAQEGSDDESFEPKRPSTHEEAVPVTAAKWPRAASNVQPKPVAKQEESGEAVGHRFSVPLTPSKRQRGRPKGAKAAVSKKPEPRKTASTKKPQPKAATRGRPPKCPIETTQEETPIRKRKLSAAMNDSTGIEVDEQAFKENESKVNKLPHEIFAEEHGKKVYSGRKKAAPLDDESSAFDDLVKSLGLSESKNVKDEKPILESPKRENCRPASPKLFDEVEESSDGSYEAPKPKSRKKSQLKNFAEKDKYGLNAQAKEAALKPAPRQLKKTSVDPRAPEMHKDSSLVDNRVQKPKNKQKDAMSVASELLQLMDADDGEWDAAKFVEYHKSKAGVAKEEGNPKKDSSGGQLKLKKAVAKEPPKLRLKQAAVKELLDKEDSSSASASDCLVLGTCSRPPKVVAGPAYEFEDLFAHSERDEESPDIIPQLPSAVMSKFKVDSEDSASEESPTVEPKTKKRKLEPLKSGKRVAKSAQRILPSKRIVESEDSHEDEDSPLVNPPKKLVLETRKEVKKSEEATEKASLPKKRLSSGLGITRSAAGPSKETLALKDLDVQNQSTLGKSLGVLTRRSDKEMVEGLLKKLKALLADFKLQENMAKDSLRLRIAKDMKATVHESIELEEAYRTELANQTKVVKSFLDGLRKPMAEWDERVDIFSKKAKAMRNVSKLSLNKEETIKEAIVIIAEFQNKILVRVRETLFRYINFVSML